MPPAHRSRVYVLLSMAIALVALPRSAMAAITLQIQGPLPNALVGDTIQVTATITSDYQLVSVSADLGGAVGALAYNNGIWKGPIDVSSVSSGAYPLVVTATDVFTGQASAQVFVQLDRPPTLVVTAPARSQAPTSR